MYTRFLTAAVTSFIVSTSSASAALVTAHAEGSINLVDSPLAERFSVGMPWSLTYTYDTGTPDVVSDEKIGAFPESIYGFNLLIGDYQLQGTAGTIRITNSADYQTDSYVYASTRGEPGSLGCFYTCAYFTGDPVGQREPFGVWLTLLDPTATAFDSDALPAGVPSLNAFPSLPLIDYTNGNAHFSLEFAREWGVAAFDYAKIRGSVDSLTVVPAPATAWLFASALGVLGWFRRTWA